MSSTSEQFKNYLKQLRQYDQVTNLLQWDLQTAAPRKGLESKLEALSFFSTEAFRLRTSPEYGAMLKKLSQPEELNHLDTGMQTTVKRCYRDYIRSSRVPRDFFTEYVVACGRSEKAWEDAKRKCDFAVFAPHLEKMIAMTRQYAQYQEPDMEPYEMLLDCYEEGMDSAAIDRIFEELKSGLLPLLKRIQAAPSPDLSVLEGHYDIDAQKKVQKLLLSYIGYDFEGGTVAESEHPFTMGLCHGDIRVTNHYLEDQPLSAMFSAIHEGGHAIFEQNIDPVYRNTAVEAINLMGLHESQSRFYENILGRNINFWLPIYEKLGKLLPQFQEISPETFCRAINNVHPSMIRTEADEVTYCLHIILRYEMEKAIFRDQIPVEQLPALWNDKMEQLLGIRPANDGEGILQDMHWSDGSFGYFPSYLLGSIYDGMFLCQLKKELGNPDTILKQGRVSDITKWLNERIHRYGSLYNSKEVIERVCGCQISAQPLLDYFTEKYTSLYGL